MQLKLGLILCLAFPIFAQALLAQERATDDGIKGSRPNVVLMLSDDMGWNDPSFNGGSIELTPHLDQLSQSGVRLTQFYVHSVCSPTRAALLTGRYSFRTWTDWRSEDFGKPTYLSKLGLELAVNEEGDETRRIHGLDTNERTIAEALRDAGYFTSIIGKWHCGEWLPEHLPMGQGFMHQYGHYGWGIDYTNYTIPHNAPARYAVYDWHRNQQPLDEQGYTTDLIANEAVRIISQHKYKGDEDQPFFIYVPFNAIHGPLEEIPRYRDTLDKRSAALKCLDDAVGRIVGAIDQNGLSENTLVIFANDNGGLRDEFNAPYRGTKNTNYEGGVRVPCVMRWPSKLQPNTENNQMMHVTDLYPTLVSLANGSLQQEREIDGIDMTDTIFAGKSSRRTEIIFDVEGCVRPPCMRRGDYKLIGKELYNIVEDPSERVDIAKDHPELVAELQARLDQAGKERPPLGTKDILMTPALPWVYGQQENQNAPEWLKQRVSQVRATQPTTWAPGTTPWPQAPIDGKIEYTGDGR